LVHLTVAISELATVSKPIIPVSATEQIGEYVDVAVGRVFLNPVESISEVAEATLRLARIQAYASISESSQVKPSVKLTAENSLTQLAALRVSKILIDLVESIRDGGYITPILRIPLSQAVGESAALLVKLAKKFSLTQALNAIAEVVKLIVRRFDVSAALGELVDIFVAKFRVASTTTVVSARREPIQTLFLKTIVSSITPHTKVIGILRAISSITPNTKVAETLTSISIITPNTKAAQTTTVVSYRFE